MQHYTRWSKASPNGRFSICGLPVTLRPHPPNVWTNPGTFYRHQADFAAAKVDSLRSIARYADAAANSNLERLYAQLEEQGLSS